MLLLRLRLRHLGHGLGPLELGLDDLHHADDPGVRALHAGVGSVEDLRLLLGLEARAGFPGLLVEVLQHPQSLRDAYLRRLRVLDCLRIFQFFLQDKRINHAEEVAA